uniref:acylphosphatase n=1 Tax=Leptospirillum ferriphilum TaxID=178606 RepID=A0A7C3QVH9_9BACT
MSSGSSARVTEILKVTGQVQGVGFRAFVQRVATRLEISGFVENRPDGSVYLEASGSPDDMEKLAALLRKGPPASTVLAVERKKLQEAPLHAGPFEIRRP